MKKALCITLSAILMIACQKEDINNSLSKDGNEKKITNETLLILDSVEVTSDKALNFLSQSAYSRIIDTLLKCPQKQLDTWEESIDFRSMRKSVNELIEQSFATLLIKDNDEIVEENPSIVKLERGNIKPVIEANFYRYIINNEGVFYLKGQKYKVTENYVRFQNQRYDSITNKLISEDVNYIYNRQEYTTKAPEANKLDGNSGTFHSMLTLIPGSSDELWLETKYKLYGSLVGNANPLPGQSSIYAGTINYYLQIDSWLWKTDFNQSRWSYYRPTFHLYFKDIRIKLNTSTRVIEKQPSNPVGADNEYYFSWTENLGAYYSNFIRPIIFPGGKLLTIEESAKYAGYLNYIMYKAGCTDYGNTITVSFGE